jgi:hypothetical protein
LQLRFVDHPQSVQTELAAVLQFGHGTHFVQQTQLLHLAAELRRALRLVLIALHEGQRILQERRFRTVLVEQALAVFLVEAGKLFVHADQQLVRCIVVLHRDKRVTTHESRHVTRVPLAVFVQIEVFRIAQTQQRHRHQPARQAREHDRIFARHIAELDQREGHAVGARGETQVVLRLQSKIAMGIAVEHDDTVVEKQRFH